MGISALIVENKLQAETYPFVVDNVRIVNEEDVFYPQSMHIELTKSCNLNCYYCYRNSGPNVTENRISTEALLSIILKLSERGLAVAELTGGEPLLHPDFFQILKFCCNKLSLVSVLTNGTLVNENFIEKIKPFKNKIVFSISLDSYLEKEHDRKSGVQGSFKKAVNAIRLLSKEKIIVRASMAVDDKNWDHIEKTLLFAKSIGATKFTYSPIIPVGRVTNKTEFLYGNKISISDVVSYEKYLMTTYSDFLHILDGYAQDELTKAGGCGAGSKTFVMNPEGDIRMCATFENGIIGNATQQTLKDIFSSSLCKLTAQVIPPTIESCQECRYASFCIGCLLRASIGIGKIGFDNCIWLSKTDISKQWFSEINQNPKKNRV